MAREENHLAGSTVAYESKMIGMTPDGNWAWHVVIHPWRSGAILGIIAESKEFERWSGDLVRHYRTVSYEPGREEGSVSYSSATSIEGAVQGITERYEKMKEFMGE